MCLSRRSAGTAAGRPGSTEPYVGRGDFLTFFLYHPQSARVAIIPLPPDLFLYLPATVCSAFLSAYALGGARIGVGRVDYNLGLLPDQYIFANLDDFTILLMNWAGSMCRSVKTSWCLRDRIHIGTVFMTGETALCYTSVREGADQDARAKRQMQILRLRSSDFSRRDLRRLPEFYSLFLDRLDTNLSARDVADAMPLLIAQADEDQQAAFAIGAEQTRLWQISDQPPATLSSPA